MTRRIPPPPPNMDVNTRNYMFQVQNILNETISELYNGTFITTEKGTATTAAQAVKDSAALPQKVSDLKGDIDRLRQTTNQNMGELRDDLEQLTTEVAATGRAMHPVGTVYFSTVETFDPAAAFGGVWETMTIEQLTGIYAWKCTGEGEENGNL